MHMHIHVSDTSSCNLPPCTAVNATCFFRTNKAHDYPLSLFFSSLKCICFLQIHGSTFRNLFRFSNCFGACCASFRICCECNGKFNVGCLCFGKCICFLVNVFRHSFPVTPLPAGGLSHGFQPPPLPAFLAMTPLPAFLAMVVYKTRGWSRWEPRHLVF